jgi:hypothetical protein
MVIECYVRYIFKSLNLYFNLFFYDVLQIIILATPCNQNFCHPKNLQFSVHFILVLKFYFICLYFQNAGTIVGINVICVMILSQYHKNKVKAVP